MPVPSPAHNWNLCVDLLALVFLYSAISIFQFYNKYVQIHQTLLCFPHQNGAFSDADSKWKTIPRMLCETKAVYELNE